MSGNKQHRLSEEIREFIVAEKGQNVSNPYQKQDKENISQTHILFLNQAYIEQIPGNREH